MAASILGYYDSGGNFVSLCSSAGVAISSSLTLSPTNLATSAKQDTLAALVATNAGAANIAVAQATSTASAATLVAARATRRRVQITNTDSTYPVYVGPATVSAGNGYYIKALQTIALTWIGLIQIIDDGTHHCVVTVADEYD